MIMQRPLDEVFRTWSHVAVLRTLVDTNTGFTGNEIGRLAGMQPRSALKALTSLEELGLVRRQRGGRDHLFTLNREHFLVTEAVLPLLSAEQRFSDGFKQTLASLLARHVVSATVFGSTAKGEETARSDYDLCCVVKTKDKKEAVLALLDEHAPVLLHQYGVRIAPLLMTALEFGRKRSTPLVNEILKSGKLIIGEHLENIRGNNVQTKRSKGS